MNAENRTRGVTRRTALRLVGASLGALALATATSGVAAASPSSERYQSFASPPAPYLDHPVLQADDTSIEREGNLIIDRANARVIQTEPVVGWADNQAVRAGTVIEPRTPSDRDKYIAKSDFYLRPGVITPDSRGGIVLHYVGIPDPDVPELKVAMDELRLEKGRLRVDLKVVTGDNSSLNERAYQEILFPFDPTQPGVLSLRIVEGGKLAYVQLDNIAMSPNPKFFP